MQKINPNIEEDNFRKILKEKLEGYSLPVSDDVWNKIESSLNKKSRKVILWPWIAGTAAAAAAVLFILLLYPLGDKAKQVNNYETTSPLSDYAKKINKDVPVEKPKRNPVIKETKGEYAEVDSRPEIDVVKEDKKNTKEDVNNVHSEKVEKTDRQQEKIVYPNPDPFGEDSPSNKKIKKRKSISFSLGSGGNLAAMNTNSNSNNLMFDNIMAQLRSNSSVNNSYSYAADAMAFKPEEQLLLENFPEVIYRVPLSFGLTVKKELNRTFSLETGLGYTFLDTRFENFNLKRKALLQLHYVGIPLNVQARIFGNKNSDWDIYLSAGGMVEKGIYSHYKQMNYANGNPVVEVISNDRIDGLQYSLSLSPGIDYKIYRNYSVYLEPKISYYFDNKQPFSARTEHPVVIGINAGLRFYW